MTSVPPPASKKASSKFEVAEDLHPQTDAFLTRRGEAGIGGYHFGATTRQIKKKEEKRSNGLSKDLGGEPRGALGARRRRLLGFRVGE